MNQHNFFAELKRRNVYKVAIAYIVGGWALSQGVAQVFPVFDVPSSAIRAIVLVIILGLPVALVLAWMFELTPQGIKRTETADAMPAAAKPKKYVWIYIVVIAGAISIGLFFLGRYTASNNTSAARTEAAATVLPKKSIAVLPFDNLSRDPDNAFFGEGVQDEILTRLAKIADLKVISRTSTQRFKSAPEDLRQIAKQLGVTNILEGSVQKSNDQVRVNVQLINAMTDAHLWAETYDRKLTDMFAVETEVAKAVADNLRVKLTGREIDEMSVRPTEDPIAHDLFVKGRYCLGLRRGDNLPRAIDFFQQVIARDPNYAAAYAGLGEAYTVLPRYTAADRKETFLKAKEAALKAMELNPNLAEAHNVLAKLAYDRDLDFAA